MNGRVGIVTADGSGIGRASARGFAVAGATVVVSDVDDAAGVETVRLIVEAGGAASYVHADVSVEDDVAARIATTVERFGRLDWAHNNAAAGAASAPITMQKRATWERVLGVTLIGTMLCLKHELAQLHTQGNGGAIVNTVSGLTGMANQSPYVAAKWGVIGLTKTAALENAAAGIRVNATCPGATATPALRNWSTADASGFDALRSTVPMGFLAEPEQQAAVAVWLCSDAASYLTGAAIPVDGGLTAA